MQRPEDDAGARLPLRGDEEEDGEDKAAALKREGEEEGEEEEGEAEWLGPSNVGRRKPSRPSFSAALPGRTSISPVSQHRKKRETKGRSRMMRARLQT